MRALKALADTTLEALRRKLKAELDPEELERLQQLPPEYKTQILDNPVPWRITKVMMDMAVEELLRRHDPETQARSVKRLASLLSTGRMDIASKEGGEKTLAWLVKLIAVDAEQGPGAKAGAKADVERRERPADIAFAKVMRRLGIEEAVQDLERLAALDDESLQRELGIEDTVKSIRQLKRLFGID